MADSKVRYLVISDTHGRLHRAVFDVAEGVSAVFHCGDVGSSQIITDLEAIAPVYAVCGNMDGWPLAGRLQDARVEDVEGGPVALAHGQMYGHSNDAIAAGLMRDFSEAAPRAICFGHSHDPYLQERNGVLLLNPGSVSIPHSGQRRTVAILEIQDGNLSARHVEIG